MLITGKYITFLPVSSNSIFEIILRFETYSKNSIETKIESSGTKIIEKSFDSLQTIIETNEEKDAIIAVNCQTFDQIRNCINYQVPYIHISHTKSDLGYLIQKLFSTIQLYKKITIVTFITTPFLKWLLKKFEFKYLIYYKKGIVYGSLGVCIYSIMNLCYYTWFIGKNFLKYKVFEENNETYLISNNPTNRLTHRNDACNPSGNLLNRLNTFVISNKSSLSFTFLLFSSSIVFFKIK
jgi:hypothetical protein